MKTSNDVSVVPSSKVRPAGRALAIVTVMCLSLSACETMKDTMDSINIFDEDKADATAAESNSTDATADPRKRAVVRAGVQPVSPQSVGYYMDQQEAKLREQLEGTGVTVTRVDETIVLSDEFSQTYVDIIGHTDSKGSKEYNQRLSEKRAKSIARYLETNAVITERVMADGMGEDDPIANNDTREGRAMNRRVEIKLSPVT
jgi:outer membrane protein OmpA-like peptidoglycan-associated protein